ncbi:response regulator transcription factor [Oricola cellulosilytica]|uniref:Response regulator transcription factor n=1 Tax=Oricola cellulosilytica TaxID=1429082 RepID=A0A4R0PE64_9HYPH|nr:response regulator transcription factor [Oricola cellulosilytica]TCD14908.1 response regulator transcription factor [Oricola cellulosilytica]
MTRGAIRIAIIEDDPDIASILTETMREQEFDSRHFSRCQDFLDAMPDYMPDMCLVDLGLPDTHGLDLVRKLEAIPSIATIIISGRGSLTDKIVGLEMGADDYVAKPFEPAEIVARVRSVLRRAQRSASAVADRTGRRRVRFADWTVDCDNFILTHVSGRSETLSLAEMAVLKVFLDSPNRLLSRPQILDTLEADPDKNFDRSVDVRISRLRTKLNEDPQNPKLIKTVYGAGYLFVGDVVWE